MRRPCVVLATDGSEHSLAAARAGVALAGEDARYLLVRAEAPLPVMPPSGRFTTAAATEPMIEAQHQEAERSLEEVAGALPVDVEPLVVQGAPAEAILRVADDEQADLVVVGSRGLGAVKRALLGSVSTAVVQRSDRPVLVVPG